MLDLEDRYYEAPSNSVQSDQTGCRFRAGIPLLCGSSLVLLSVVATVASDHVILGTNAAKSVNFASTSLVNWRQRVATSHFSLNLNHISNQGRLHSQPFPALKVHPSFRTAAENPLQTISKNINNIATDYNQAKELWDTYQSSKLKEGQSGDDASKSTKEKDIRQELTETTQPPKPKVRREGPATPEDFGYFSAPFQFIERTKAALEDDDDGPQIFAPGSVIYSPELKQDDPFGLEWSNLDDDMIGGRTKSFFNVDTGVWSGNIVSENGGFAAIRSRLLLRPFDFTQGTGMRLKIKGKGQRLKFVLRDNEDFDGLAWSYSFDTNPFFDTTQEIPWVDFLPTLDGKVVTKDVPVLNVASITNIQITYSKLEYDGKPNPRFTEGEFEFLIKELSYY